MNQIDLTSKLPMYFQIQKEIEYRIKNEWAVEQQIPSEAFLMDEFGVSRNTVKKAIEELVNQNLLYRVQGKGTFVRNKQIVQPLDKLYSFSQVYQQQGFELKNKIISIREIVPNAFVKELFNLTKETESVIELIRLRCLNDEPIIYEKSYLNTRFVNLVEPIYELNTKNLYDILSEYFGISISYAEESFGAANLMDEETNLLEAQHRDAAIVIERKAYTKTNELIEYCESKIKKGSFKFSIKLQ